METVTCNINVKVFNKFLCYPVTVCC